MRSQNRDVSRNFASREQLAASLARLKNARKAFFNGLLRGPHDANYRSTDCVPEDQRGTSLGGQYVLLNGVFWMRCHPVEKHEPSQNQVRHPDQPSDDIANDR